MGTLYDFQLYQILKMIKLTYLILITILCYVCYRIMMMNDFDVQELEKIFLKGLFQKIVLKWGVG